MRRYWEQHNGPCPEQAWRGAMAACMLLGLLAAGCGSGGAGPASPAAGGSTSATPGSGGGTSTQGSVPPQGLGDAVSFPGEYIVRGGAANAILREAREFHSIATFGINTTRSEIIPTMTAAAQGRGRTAPAAIEESQDTDSGMGYSGTVNPDGSGQVHLYRDAAHLGGAGSMSWTTPTSAAGKTEVGFTINEVHGEDNGTLTVTAGDASGESGTCSMQTVSNGNVRGLLTFAPASGAGQGLTVVSGSIHYDDMYGHNQTVPINPGSPMDAWTLGPFTTQAFAQVVLPPFSTTDQATINYYPGNSALCVVRNAAGSLLGESAAPPSGTMTNLRYFAPGGLYADTSYDLDEDIIFHGGPINAVDPGLPALDPGPPLEPDSTATTTR